MSSGLRGTRFVKEFRDRLSRGRIFSPDYRRTREPRRSPLCLESLCTDFQFQD